MIIIKNREMLMPDEEQTLGTNYDMESENRVFRVNRFLQGGVDVSAFTFRLDLKYEDGNYDTIVLDQKEITENYVYLTWTVQHSILQQPGTLWVAIRAIDDEATVRWSSFVTPMWVEHHLNTPANYTGDLTEIEQIEQDHIYMKSVIDDLEEHIDYARDSEAWAVGQRDGVDVPTTDITWHNNAKYYARYAGETGVAQLSDELANLSTQAAQNSEAIEALDTQVTQNASDIAQNALDVEDYWDTMKNNFANNETTDYASQNYAVGDYLVTKEGVFCKVIQAIASGAQLIYGTNIVGVWVGQELASLNGAVNAGIITYTGNATITYTAPSGIVNPTVTLYGERYLRFGNLVYIGLIFSISNAGTPGGHIKITPPFSATNGFYGSATCPSGSIVGPNGADITGWTVRMYDGGHIQIAKNPGGGNFTVASEIPTGVYGVCAWGIMVPGSAINSGTVRTFNLSISQGSNSTVTVVRTASPRKNASTGTLSNGSPIYTGDVLTVTFGASSGYAIDTHTVNGITFKSGNQINVTKDLAIVSTAKVGTNTIYFRIVGIDHPDGDEPGWNNPNKTLAFKVPVGMTWAQLKAASAIAATNNPVTIYSKDWNGSVGGGSYVSIKKVGGSFANFTDAVWKGTSTNGVRQQGTDVPVNGATYYAEINL